MQITVNHNVYSCILGELEWYGITEEQRLALCATCVSGAKKARCQYVSVMVFPDPVMSIAPIRSRHQVYRFTIPLPNEEAFENALYDACERSALSPARKRSIAKRVFEL